MSAYRNDEDARAERANSLVDEIAGLERKKIEHAAAERRLEEARRELSDLQTAPVVAPPPPKHPGLFAHLAVFAGTASVAFVAYTLFT